jgi:tetratricopeptide (TPR) repeat protein
MTAAASKARTFVSPQTVDRWRLYALIDALEGDLRDALREWVLPFKNLDEILGSRAPLIRQRAVDEGVVETDADFVSYLDFHDAFSLLNRHEAMIPATVARVIKEQTPRLDVFVPVRNRVMHGRPLLPDDPELTLRLCSDLLDSRAPWPRLRVVTKHLLDDPTWTPLVAGPRPRLERILHNLPIPDFDETGLLGRDQENTRAVTMLLKRQHRVLTIVGEGGIGKTALAVKSLYDVVDHVDCPYEAILWSSLKTEMLTGRGVKEIADAARDVIGITRSLGAAFDDDFAGSVSDLAEALEGVTSLVVIDNLETASAQEIIELTDGLPPTTSFLLTSRVGLGELERRVPLEPLNEQAAEIMFRKLAERRELPHLSKLPATQIRAYVRKLRHTPLAIKWFIEAVDAGGQPDELLRDQTMLLNFCMSSIYESLDEAARDLLAVLYAVDQALGLSDMAIVSDLSLDDLRRGVHELRRRSLVDVHALPGAALVQRYSLAPATREYMRTAAQPAEDVLGSVQARLVELRRSETHRRRDEARAFLMPHAVALVSDEQKPLAHLLREAYFANRDGDIDTARSLISDARRLDPEFFEVPRIEAFVEAGHRPDRAIELYQEAHALAPPQFKGKVAFFHAGLLMSILKAPDLAEPLAEEAHSALQVAETALRLAQVRLALGKFDAAAQLLEEAAATANDERTSTIARTQLAQVAARQVDRLRRADHLDEALSLGIKQLAGALAALEEGPADSMLRPNALELVTEMTHVLVKLRDLADHETAIAGVLQAAQVLMPATPSFRRKDQWDRALAELVSRTDVPRDVARAVGDIRAGLFAAAQPLEGGRRRGLVHRFFVGKGGLIISGDDSPYVPFESDAVTLETAGLLLPGAAVSYEVGDRDGERATAVRFEGSPDEQQAALRDRRGTVVKTTYDYLFAVDKLTGVFVFVHRNHFRQPTEWELLDRGDDVDYDLEISSDGRWRAARNSARLARGT